MPQRHHPKSNEASQHGDDFRRIAGIGPVLAQRLWDAGILTYQDLARRAPEEIAAVLANVAGISPERIASQDWTGQARHLAEPLPEPADPRQHYASFHLEFLLVSDDSVRRTKIHHHQTGIDVTWPGWDEDRLISVLRDRMPLTAAPRAADTAELQPPPVRSSSQPPAAVPSGTSHPPPATPSESLPPSSLGIEELTSIRDGQISYIRRHDEPTSVRLTLRINATDRPLASTFDCTAEIAARKLGGHERVALGATHGTIRVNDPLSLELTGPPLPPGLYRLVVAVVIYQAGHSAEDQPLHSLGANGDLLQVANAPDDNVPV
jgi:hypothetical protein